MAKAQHREIPTEVSEAEIAVHWREEELYLPSTKFIAQAMMLNAFSSYIAGVSEEVSRTAMRATLQSSGIK